MSNLGRALKNVQKGSLPIIYIRRTTPGALHESSDCFEYQKRSLLSDQATPKNNCQIFLPKRIPDSKLIKPKKILRSSPSLEIPISTPPPPPPPPPFSACHRSFSLFVLFIRNRITCYTVKMVHEILRKMCFEINLTERSRPLLRYVLSAIHE